MLTTWTSANRVISEALTSTFDRSLKTIMGGNGNWCDYFVYRRVRTMSYSYVGLTEAAAKACASALNTKFNRRYSPYVWDADNRIWTTGSLDGRDQIFRQCGTAKPMHGEGHVWSVAVQLNEDLSQPYRPSPSEYRDAQVYQAFEADPSIMTNLFKGYAEASGRIDFDYDLD